MSATELQELAIDEVSGVDAPANGVPGWMVLKSEAGAAADGEAQLAALYATIGQARVLEGAPDAVRKAAEDLAEYVEKQLADEDDKPLIVKMRKMFKKRDKELAKELKKARAPKKPNPFATEDDGDDDDDGDSTPPGKPVKKSKELDFEPIEKALDTAVEKALEPVQSDLDAFRDVIEKAFDRIEALEDLVVGSSQAYGQEGGVAPVEKSEYTLRDAIMSAAAGNRVTIN